jgi:hypothetical protein
MLLQVAIFAAASSAAAPAFADEDEPPSAAVAANVGFQTVIGPVLIVPPDGGPLGGGLDFDLRYGIKAGPTIIGPGGRLSGYFISGRFIGTAMPTLRVTLPFGPFAPFLVGGVGGGWISNPSEGGVALLGGGGVMIHFGRFFAIGAEATYQTITSTEFGVWAVGPMIALSL